MEKVFKEETYIIIYSDNFTTEIWQKYCDEFKLSYDTEQITIFTSKIFYYGKEEENDK